MHVSRSRPGGARSRGFSLIELLIVIAVLAATAGLLIGRVDWVRRSADSATSLAGIAQVHQNLQVYRVAKSVYPDRFDSLLAAGAGGAQPTAKYSKVWNHATPTFEVTSILLIVAAVAAMVLALRRSKAITQREIEEHAGEDLEAYGMAPPGAPASMRERAR